MISNFYGNDLWLLQLLAKFLGFPEPQEITLNTLLYIEVVIYHTDAFDCNYNGSIREHK